MSIADSLNEFYKDGRPLQDYVAIKRLPPKLVSDGGIIIPHTAAEHARPFQGIVVSVGPGRFDGKGKRLPAPEVEPGDHVCFGRYAGAESALEDTDFWLVRGELIDAVIEP